MAEKYNFFERKAGYAISNGIEGVIGNYSGNSKIYELKTCNLEVKKYDGHI